MGLKLDRVRDGLVLSVKGKLWVSEWLTLPYGATVGALDANDAYGDPIVFRKSIDGKPLPKTGWILAAKMIDRDDVATALTLHVYSRQFAAAASDAAFTISAADAENWVTNLAFSVMNDEGSGRAGELVDIDSPFWVDANVAERGLWAQASTTGTPTPTNGGMPRFQLYLEDLE